jgi:hypothetical protein
MLRLLRIRQKYFLHLHDNDVIRTCFTNTYCCLSAIYQSVKRDFLVDEVGPIGRFYLDEANRSNEVR